MITQLPGFQDTVRDAQTTFRSLLDSMARPGIVFAIAATLEPPDGLTSTCAVACLTLLDLETRVWLQPEIPDASRDWLLFHTGCRFTDSPRNADFALIAHVNGCPNLTDFNRGSSEYPEASTTLLIQVDSLTGGEPVILQGAGILDEIAIAPQLPVQFWQQWQINAESYPLGVDVFCFDRDRVMGLPRSSQLKDFV